MHNGVCRDDIGGSFSVLYCCVMDMLILLIGFYQIYILQYALYAHNFSSSYLICNTQYPVLTRVRELGLLEQTAELGLLSKLEKQGLTLQKAEELLPVLEDLGVLSLVANNQQLLINGVAPLAVEGAPLILPVLAGALDIGAPAFFGGAAVAAGLDAYLFASGAEVPFVGLSAGALAGLLLIPLSVVLAIVGGAIGNLKN